MNASGTRVGATSVPPRSRKAAGLSAVPATGTTAVEGQAVALATMGMVMVPAITEAAPQRILPTGSL